jgi:hypothetical protein
MYRLVSTSSQIRYFSLARIVTFLEPRFIHLLIEPNIATLLDAAARTPMSDILVATPSSNTGPSPRNPPSPGDSLPQNNERSAMTIAAKESLKISRAHLFAQKHHTDLLRGMDLQEQWFVYPLL